MSRYIEGQVDQRRILFPIRVLQPTPSTDIFGIEVTALLDTGSTISGVTPTIAQRLSLSKRGKRPIGSVQGLGQAERYTFRLGVTGTGGATQLPFVFADVVGFELGGGFAFDALIGMDILSQCDFSMERSGRWTLSFGS